jgi:membrane carboxypeptidase/penicillin-binding protein PbpC
MPVALSVEATGTGALQYQWFKDATPLAGANTQSLFIPSLSATDAGSYHVSVTDSVGTIVSAAATVNVELVHIVPSSFDLWDANLGGTVSAQSDLQATSAPNGLFDDGETGFANATEGTVHFVEWSTPAPVLVTTVRLFARGENLNNANLGEFSSFTLKAKSPGSATFDITVGTFTPAHPYILLDSETAALLDTVIPPTQASAFRAEFVQVGASGPRVIELDAFGTRPLVVPAVVVQPESQTVARNADTTLSVIARGGNLQYQWRFNGANIAGANSNTLLVHRMSKQDEGAYSVVVWNELGSVESAAASLIIQKKH